MMWMLLSVQTLNKAAYVLLKCESRGLRWVDNYFKMKVIRSQFSKIQTHTRNPSAFYHNNKKNHLMVLIKRYAFKTDEIALISIQLIR